MGRLAVVTILYILYIHIYVIHKAKFCVDFEHLKQTHTSLPTISNRQFSALLKSDSGEKNYKLA